MYLLKLLKYEKISSKTIPKVKTVKSFASAEDIPMLAINLKIWKYCALIISRVMLRRFLIIGPIIILNFTQFFQLYSSNESVETKIRNAYVAVLMLDVIIRSTNVCLKRRQYEEFLEFMRTLYVEVVSMKDVEIQRMLAECEQKAQKLTKINLIMGASVCVGLVVYTIFVSERVLPFSAAIPFMDVYQTPWYQIVYFCHIIIIPHGALLFIPFTIIIVSFILFAIMMCRLLQYKLRSLTQLRHNQVYDEIIWCIKYQLTLIRFVNTINSLNGLLFLMEYLLYGIMLCAVLFSMIIVNTLTEMLIISLYMLMTFTQSLLLYYYANELYEESLLVATAAYDINWFDYDIATQKTLKLFLMRSQKPCALLLGNVYPMNLHKLQSLLKVSYSFYTLLKRMYG